MIVFLRLSNSDTVECNFPFLSFRGEPHHALEDLALDLWICKNIWVTGQIPSPFPSANALFHVPTPESSSECDGVRTPVTRCVRKPSCCLVGLDKVGPPPTANSRPSTWQLDIQVSRVEATMPRCLPHQIGLFSILFPPRGWFLNQPQVCQEPTLTSLAGQTESGRLFLNLWNYKIVLLPSRFHNSWAAEDPRDCQLVWHQPTVGTFVWFLCLDTDVFPTGLKRSWQQDRTKMPSRACTPGSRCSNHCSLEAAPKPELREFVVIGE